MINLVGDLGGPEDQKCFLRVFIGVFSLGVQKVIFGGFDKK